MDNQKIGQIKRIIYWMNEIESINKFCKEIRFSRKGDINKIFRTKYIFEHKIKSIYNLSGNRIEIDNNLMCMFCEFLKQQEKHVQELVDGSDKDLVDIAKEYMNGNFGELIEK